MPEDKLIASIVHEQAFIHCRVSSALQDVALLAANFGLDQDEFTQAARASYLHAREMLEGERGRLSTQIAEEARMTAREESARSP